MKKLSEYKALIIGVFGVLAALSVGAVWIVVNPSQLTPEQLADRQEYELEKTIRRLERLAEEEPRESPEYLREVKRGGCDVLMNGPWYEYAGVREIRSNDVIVDPDIWVRLRADKKEEYLKQIAHCGHGMWGLDVIDSGTGKEIATWGPIFGLDVD